MGRSVSKTMIHTSPRYGPFSLLYIVYMYFSTNHDRTISRQKLARINSFYFMLFNGLFELFLIFNVLPIQVFPVWCPTFLLLHVLTHVYFVIKIVPDKLSFLIYNSLDRVLFIYYFMSNRKKKSFCKFI